MSELIGFALGVISGLLTNIIWVRRGRLRSLAEGIRQPKYEPLGFTPAEVGLFPLNRWTTARPLQRNHLQVSVTETRPQQQWFNESEWQRIADEFHRRYTGDIGFLTDASIDHRESREGEDFRYTITPCDYSEHLATVEYLRRHPEAQSRIRASFADGDIIAFARTSPPTSIKINVAVLNLDNEFLAVQRSGAVDFKRGVWTVGPNEGMKLARHTTPGDPPEDFFDLGERCLREELNLEPVDYSGINISWVGYEVKTIQFKVYAQVRTHLSKREVNERLLSSHSLFEAQDTKWIPFQKKYVMDIVQNWESGDSADRKWSSSAPHTLQEMWRMRHLLRLTDHP
ncbi:hypothetical protein [Streptomyces sp. NPDC098781]|uniref:hypothetical protein n=1 Tax=Streptomyces sp. NPDC098781 TaxID=3366097 RepID=UPI00382FDC7B